MTGLQALTLCILFTANSVSVAAPVLVDLRDETCQLLYPFSPHSSQHFAAEAAVRPFVLNTSVLKSTVGLLSIAVCCGLEVGLGLFIIQGV